MKLLLDTHIALWAIEGDPKLGDRARGVLNDRENDVHISAVTVWEIAIKYALQRGSRNDMPISGHAALKLFKEAGYPILAINADHAAAVDHLPRLHADPFNRMLVAQALTEPMHLLTRDARLKEYGALVMAA